MAYDLVEFSANSIHLASRYSQISSLSHACHGCSLSILVSADIDNIQVLRNIPGIWCR